jgi:hypothetical protein
LVANAALETERQPVEADTLCLANGFFGRRMRRQKKVLFLSPRNRKLNLKREIGKMWLHSRGESNTSIGKMSRTNILRAQKHRGGSSTTELALRDARNVARVSFILLASLKILEAGTGDSPNPRSDDD